MQYRPAGYLYQGKTSKKGDDYWTGYVMLAGTKHLITVFKNKGKVSESDNLPHLAIFMREDKKDA